MCGAHSDVFKLFKDPLLTFRRTSRRVNSKLGPVFLNMLVRVQRHKQHQTHRIPIFCIPSLKQRWPPSIVFSLKGHLVLPTSLWTHRRAARITAGTCIYAYGCKQLTNNCISSIPRCSIDVLVSWLMRQCLLCCPTRCWFDCMTRAHMKCFRDFMTQRILMFRLTTLTRSFWPTAQTWFGSMKVTPQPKTRGPKIKFNSAPKWNRHGPPLSESHMVTIQNLILHCAHVLGQGRPISNPPRCTFGFYLRPPCVGCGCHFLASHRSAQSLSTAMPHLTRRLIHFTGSICSLHGLELGTCWWH